MKPCRRSRALWRCVERAALVAALGMLTACSAFTSGRPETNPVARIDDAREPAPKWYDYTLYGIVGFPRDLVDLPFSAIVALEQATNEPGDLQVAIAGGPIIVGVLSPALNYPWWQIQWSVYLFAASGAYVSWVLVIHPVETALLRTPYDMEWWVLGERKSKSALFFPNYHGMLKRGKR